MGKSSGGIRGSGKTQKKSNIELYEALNNEIEKLGYFTSINRSKNNFGESDYIYVSTENDEFGFIDKNSAIKIRISDHSVTNIDRVFNEYHIDKNKKFKDVKQGLIDHINFKLRRDKYFIKKNSSEIIKNKIETPNPYGNDKVLSQRKNKAGDKIIYTVERTYINPIEQWINKRTKKVYATIRIK